MAGLDSVAVVVVEGGSVVLSWKTHVYVTMAHTESAVGGLAALSQALVAPVPCPYFYITSAPSPTHTSGHTWFWPSWL